MHAGMDERGGQSQDVPQLSFLCVHTAGMLSAHNTQHTPTDRAKHWVHWVAPSAPKLVHTCAHTAKPNQSTQPTWLHERHWAGDEAGNHTPHKRLVCNPQGNGVVERAGHCNTPVHCTQEGHDAHTIAQLYTTQRNGEEEQAQENNSCWCAAAQEWEQVKFC